MDTFEHNMANLFAQLGLANSSQDIDKFIAENKGLPSNVSLAKANFWNSSQASFITQAINEDADWAEVVDILNSMLRD
ncbi:DUF2789 domain-containing protein [Thalassotalea sp. M1531]|uniref:DUF2789 domain-containing protein n=1 Tax=Thalassotalea algicola TaxID=2716224 RepID=A0A7Y0LFJ7_9GAMM|nr:DUF2789 domain-containing protein [Thalassotalea algicola]NMP33284.1 DUF2789 domain-containing protein [Thalassotalea algicola]